jgi:hypothetical protein
MGLKLASLEVNEDFAKAIQLGSSTIRIRRSTAARRRRPRPRSCRC